ncbi:hypothetical protein PtA15_14A208 [Puccinia triticina]|uniref:Uncharacterized protein n=1 Tax=Puccinia triticina TaxID=208348 RepID=A0ABY7D5R1_9BASI|nr:uncharacterized protein PtA15_14A208 [Puccinia triticina]WAQ91325.1 hypothetical protein PtA15_14A208 [Puccinia triticina]
MEELPQSEATQALDPAYRESVRRASKIDLYLSVRAKVISLKEMLTKECTCQGTVDHIRLWILRSQYDGAPQKDHGTPPAPRLGVQGLLHPRPLLAAPQEEQDAPGLIQLVDAM